MYNSNRQNPVVKNAKAMLGSPLFLVGAIAYSVYGLFQLLSGMLEDSSGLSRLMDQVSSIQRSYDIDLGLMQAYIRGYHGTRVVMALLSSIPVMIIIAGIWMMFASAKSKVQQSVSVTGLIMIRVIVIIQLVGTCIGLVFVEIVCIVALIMAGSAVSWYDTGYVIGLLVMAMIIIAAVYVLRIVYYIKLSSMLLSMKSAAVTGRPDAGVSKYVEIFCYLAGGVSVISALISLVGMSVCGFLANAGLATADITFAIFLMKYRMNMQMFQQNPGMTGDLQVQTPYQQPMQEQVQTPYQQPMQEQVQTSYQQPMQEQVQTSYQQPMQEQVQSYSRDNETTVLPYYNETSVLSGQFVSGGQMQLVRMTRQKTGETFCISKPSFWIGKDPANVDYCISDNGAVSRRHILVSIHNGSCYVRDNHSTNRVYINGQVIMSDMDTLVSDGDRVRLGDEEFIISIG